jgi:hypothetical protein
MKNVELHVGFKLRFWSEVQFGRDEAQIGAHLSLNNARHVLAEKPTRPPCTRARPTIVAARPALPVPLGRGRATLTPSASLYLTPHASMFLPLAPCLPWWCPAPYLPGGAPGCRRCYSSDLLPPKPSALSASCSPALPCSNVLHLLRRFHADALPAEVGQRPTSLFRAAVCMRRKKDPRVREKQLQGVFCRTSDSDE